MVATADQVTLDIEKLHPVDGDILVVTVDREITYDQAQAMTERVRRALALATGRESFPILILTNGVSIERLPAKDVTAIGIVQPRQG